MPVTELVRVSLRFSSPESSARLSFAYMVIAQLAVACIRLRSNSPPVIDSSFSGYADLVVRLAYLSRSRTPIFGRIPRQWPRSWTTITTTAFAPSPGSRISSGYQSTRWDTRMLRRRKRRRARREEKWQRDCPGAVVLRAKFPVPGAATRRDIDRRKDLSVALFCVVYAILIKSDIDLYV